VTDAIEYELPLGAIGGWGVGCCGGGMEAAFDYRHKRLPEILAIAARQAGAKSVGIHRLWKRISILQVQQGIAVDDVALEDEDGDAADVPDIDGRSPSTTRMSARRLGAIWPSSVQPNWRA